MKEMVVVKSYFGVISQQCRGTGHNLSRIDVKDGEQIAVKVQGIPEPMAARLFQGFFKKGPGLLHGLFPERLAQMRELDPGHPVGLKID